MNEEEHGLPESILEVEPGWEPRGEIDIERALRGLEFLAKRYTDVQHNAAEWRGDIDEWERQQTAAISRRATALSLSLESWALAQRRITANRVKSWTFPSGSIETTKARSKTLVEDEDALLEWCEENVPEAVKIVRSVLVSVLTKTCEVTEDGRLVWHEGEVVPGVRVQVLPDSAASATVKLASQRALPGGER